MKKDIKHWSRYGIKWYSWEETCDVCGRLIRSHATASHGKPNKKEKDYCSNCIGLISNKS